MPRLAVDIQWQMGEAVLPWKITYLRHGRMEGRMDATIDMEQAIEPERDRMLRHMQRLTAVGIAISAERNVQKIFDMIVKEAMDLTNADAATL